MGLIGRRSDIPERDRLGLNSRQMQIQIERQTDEPTDVRLARSEILIDREAMDRQIQTVAQIENFHRID